MIKGSEAQVLELKAMLEQLTLVSEANQHLQIRLLASEVALPQVVAQLADAEEAKRQCRRDIEAARQQLEDSGAALRYHRQKIELPELSRHGRRRA